MSTNRTNNAPARPFRPTLASSRSTERSPLTPRVAAASTPSVVSASRRTPITTARVKQNDGSARDDLVGSNNVTPRSAKRTSRVEQGNGTPLQADDTPEAIRARTVAGVTAIYGQAGANALGMSQNSLPRSPYSESGVQRAYSPFVRSPIASEVGTARREDEANDRFFHASDIDKIETVAAKKPEPKKAAAFFYADGQQEGQQAVARARSPEHLEQRIPPSQLTRAHTDSPATIPRSQQPHLSPALSGISSASPSPFFAHAVGLPPQKPRSPSPSKENIHLSYRKGVSQIFGSRPSPIPNQRRSQDLSEAQSSTPRPSLSHQKSISLSSIDSSLLQPSRRRSQTTHDTRASTPLREETTLIEETTTDAPQPELETSFNAANVDPAPLSPTSKSISELAADARRERKVLDLEISNSSLLAINSSLEREIRRQKTELKRFRRLSRAGRFSLAPSDGTRESGHHQDLAEGDDDFEGMNMFGPASALSDLYDESSDEDDEDAESSMLSGETDVRPDRLAKDAQRLRADLDKHKELLVQSQMMNQSLRRCMYATEDMIKDGKRALEYRVRVSDIKLGGRILTGVEDADEDGEPLEQIEVEDDFDHDGADTSNLASPDIAVEDRASSFVELWGNVGVKPSERISLESSDVGDRDSGIEVDKSFSPALNARSRLDA